MSNSLNSLPGSVASNFEDGREADVVLLNLHGFRDVAGFLDTHPQLRRTHPTPGTLERFAALEADVGATELSQIIYKAIIEAAPSLSVVKYDVNIPRAFVDANRTTPETGVYPIWDFEKAPELYKELVAIHAHIMEQIQGIMNNLNNGAVVVGVHTMADYDPVPAMKFSELQPHTVERWSQSFLQAKQRGGKKRAVDLVSGPAPGEVTTADTSLVNAIGKALDAIHTPWSINNTYILSERVVAWRHRDMFAFGGNWLDVDVPKGELVNPITRDSMDLLAPRIDNQRVTIVGTAIAQGIIEYLSNRP